MLSGLNIEASLGLIVARQVRLQVVTVGHCDGFEAMLRARGTSPDPLIQKRMLGCASRKAERRGAKATSCGHSSCRDRSPHSRHSPRVQDLGVSEFAVCGRSGISLQGANGCLRMVPQPKIADLSLLNSRLPSFDQK